jgi:hypothetical protein
MVLPQWNPDRLRRKIPFNIALTGGRKQGKSCSVAHLVELMKEDFDLVICMVGSAACNPVLEHLLKEHWDPRFFFSQWDPVLIQRLLRQQEELMGGGLKREVLIILDDVILTSDADEQLAHMAMRGRHFRISLMMCAVSYTTLPKRARRSLDVLLVFSMPMQGDFKVLTYEYCQGSCSMARFALNNLQDHECLVLETLMKKQTLFIWKSTLLILTDEDELTKTSTSPDPLESQKSDVSETPLEHPPTVNQSKTSFSSNDIESTGDQERLSRVRTV